MSKAIKDALAEPKLLSGGPVPLFDRLMDDDPETLSEHPVKKYYNRSEVIRSIEREVERILNTRATVKRAEYDDFSENPLNFGLPEMFGLGDFSQFDATNMQQTCSNGQEFLTFVNKPSCDMNLVLKMSLQPL